MVKQKVLEPRYVILFSLHKLGGRAKYKELHEETGLNTSTFYMNLKQLQLEGLVEKENSEYKLTPRGAEAIEHAKKELEVMLVGA